MTKSLSQYALLGPAKGTCTQCGVTTGVNCLVSIDDHKTYLCDFCIELLKAEIPEIYKSLQRLMKKQHEEYINSNPRYLEVIKEKEYEMLVTETGLLLSRADKVMNGRPTNNVEYKLAKLIKNGAAVGKDLKVVSNKIKKQRQYMEEIRALMRKQGEMGL